MKTIAAPLQAVIDGETTYLCRIWEISLLSGTTLRYTDLDRDLVVGGNTYVYDPGITISALAATVDGGQNASIEVNFETGKIEESMIRRGQLDGATFTIKAVHWSDTSLGTIPLFSGAVAETEWNDKLSAIITVKSALAVKSSSTDGEVYSRTCRARLGDARCQVDLDALKITCTVDSVSSDQMVITASELNASATDYFAYGTVEWLTGENADLFDEVQGNTTGTGTVRLALLPRFPIVVGDTFDIRPGCNKEATTCDTKFNNLLNFRGEPYAPPPNANPMSGWRDPDISPPTLIG